MKAIFKRLSILFTAILLAVGVCAFAACEDKPEGGGEDGTTYTVTVTVKNPDGSANAGAKVQICEVEENGQLGLCWNPESVNAQGVSVQKTHNLKPVEVHLLPSSITGYLYDSVLLDKDHTSTTINLVEDTNKRIYKIQLVAPSGADVDFTAFKVTLSDTDNDGNTHVLDVDANGVALSGWIPTAAYVIDTSPLPGYPAVSGEFKQVEIDKRFATLTTTVALRAQA